MSLHLLFLVFSCFFCIKAGANNHEGANDHEGAQQLIGVNYGLLGDNLPPSSSVVNLLNSRNIKIVRVYEPNPDVLSALTNSDIQIVIGVRNEDLQNLAADSSFAVQWVNRNVMSYHPSLKIKYIVAGNEVIPGSVAQFALGAMENLDSALKEAKINVPVSTAIHFAVLGQAYPPSLGTFTDESRSIIAPIVEFLESNNYPLLVNTYPYFAYIEDPQSINLDFALGNQVGDIVTDGTLQYNSLFEAMVDSMYSAIEKVGGKSVRIVVSETGWPSANNGDIATVANAQAYINNVVTFIRSSKGTPKRPGSSPETYIFAIFNEDLKASGTEQNFGLYRPDMTEVYHVNL